MIGFDDSRPALWTLAVRYPTSLLASWRNRATFETARCFCFFVGCPFSGTSLIAALLDAHRNGIVAHELGGFKHLLAGFGRRQIFQLLMWRSRAHARRGRGWCGYSYEVPGGWQGRVERLEVIGDKQAEGAALRIARRPWLLDRCRAVVDCPVRAIHVVRNPLDTIVTYARRRRLSLVAAARQYATRCEAVASTRDLLAPDELVELSHERFVAEPRAGLRSLARALALDPHPRWLDACASIVFPEPRAPSTEAVVDPRTRAIVADLVRRHDFLRGYAAEV